MFKKRGEKKEWLDIAEGIREGASLSDIAEKFGSKYVASMAEKVEKVSEGVGKVAETIWQKKEDNEKKGTNENAKPDNVGIVCPTCKKHKDDSAHIDQINGKGTYSRLKAQQSTNDKSKEKQ